MTLTLGSSGLISPPHQARLLIDNLALCSCSDITLWGSSISLRIDHGWLVKSVSQSVTWSVNSHSNLLATGNLITRLAWDEQICPAASCVVCVVLCCVCACGLSAIRVRGHPARIHPAMPPAEQRRPSSQPSRPNKHACLGISIFSSLGARSPSTDLTDRMGSL